MYTKLLLSLLLPPCRNCNRSGFHTWIVMMTWNLETTGVCVHEETVKTATLMDGTGWNRRTSACITRGCSHSMSKIVEQEARRRVTPRRKS